MEAKWQPIETAPKDRTCILLFIPCDGAGAGDAMTCAYYCEDHKNFVDNWNGIIFMPLHATHWMPLPEPPQ